MPVYNGEKYLDKAVQSVLDQTFSDWELLIVDDGSSDQSYSIAIGYSTRDSRVKVFKHQDSFNRGVSASRNLAVANASGKWLSLLDSDDTWFPDKLEAESSVISEFNDVVFIYSYSVKIGDEQNGEEYKSDRYYGSGTPGENSNAFKNLISGFITSTSAVTFRKDIFMICGGFNEKFSYGEDTLLFHRILEHGNLCFIDRPLGYHRIHKESVASNTSAERKVTARFRVYEELLLNVASENIPVVSEAIVKTGFRKILRSYTFFPQNNLMLVLIHLNKLLKNSKVLIIHRIMAIIMYLLEFLVVPIKFCRQILK